MANSLQRLIETGEIVVVSHRYTKEYLTAAERAFICESGFGMSPETMGTCIIGHWLDGTGKGRIEGFQINGVESLAFNAALVWQKKVFYAFPEEDRGKLMRCRLCNWASKAEDAVWCPGCDKYSCPVCGSSEKLRFVT